MTPSHRPPAAWLLAAALLCGHLAHPAATALAQEPGEKVEQAKTLFNMGAQLYSARKYVAAIQNFEEAYRLAPRPALLFSIAQAERRYYYESRQIDYLRRAIGHYKAYINQPEQGARRAEAGQALAELELVASKLDPTPAGSAAPPPPPPAPAKPTLSVMATQVKGARVWVDGKQAEEGIFSEEVAPGKHSIKVSAEGYFDEEREVSLQGSPLSLDVTLRERPATLSFVTLPGAQISVDGRLVGTTPLPVPIEVAAGAHVVTISRNGNEAFSTEVDLDRGESRKIEARLQRTTQRAVSYGFLGAAGAALVTGGVFSLLAVQSQSKAQDILDQRGKGSITQDQFDRYNKARSDRDDRFRPAAVGSFGAALGLGVIGGLLYAFDQPTARSTEARERKPRPAPSPSQPPAPMEMSAAPALGPGWMGVAAEGRF